MAPAAAHVRLMRCCCEAWGSTAHAQPHPAPHAEVICDIAPRDLEAALQGRTLVAAKRRGKQVRLTKNRRAVAGEEGACERCCYNLPLFPPLFPLLSTQMWWEFDEGPALLVHFGMTGGLVIQGKGSAHYKVGGWVGTRGACDGVGRGGGTVARQGYRCLQKLHAGEAAPQGRPLLRPLGVAARPWPVLWLPTPPLPSHAAPSASSPPPAVQNFHIDAAAWPPRFVKLQLTFEDGTQARRPPARGQAKHPARPRSRPGLQALLRTRAACLVPPATSRGPPLPLPLQLAFCDSRRFAKVGVGVGGGGPGFVTDGATLPRAAAASRPRMQPMPPITTHMPLKPMPSPSLPPTTTTNPSRPPPPPLVRRSASWPTQSACPRCARWAQIPCWTGLRQRPSRAWCGGSAGPSRRCCWTRCVGGWGGVWVCVCGGGGIGGDSTIERYAPCCRPGAGAAAASAAACAAAAGPISKPHPTIAVAAAAGTATAVAAAATPALHLHACEAQRQ